jgi:hypothetical protein
MTPTDVEDRLRRDLAREAARTQAAMLRPLTEPREAARRELTPWRARRRAWRWLAPAAAVAAVAAVLAGVALAGSGLGTRSGPASGGRAAAGLATPRFYVSVSLPPHVRVTVHRSLTGRVLASAPLPASTQGAGPVPSIAAAANDRTFAIAATVHLPHSTLAVRLFEVSLSARGHVVSFASIANLTKPASAATITGIALSPDGSQLAATEEFPTTGFHPLGQIELVSMRTGHVTRTWPGGAGIPSDPAWAGPGKLGFLWWDRIRGPVDNFTARTRERLLNTAAVGSLLGSSKVIAAAPGGRFLESALPSADGRVLFGSWYRNIPAGHGNGTAVVDFGQVGLRGHRPMVLQHRAVAFHGVAQEGQADSSCNVLSVAGRAPDALVQCPGLEKVENGWIGTLPGVGPVPVVAW